MLDDSSVAWTDVAFCQKDFSSCFAGVGQDLWDPGPAMLLLQGIPDFLEGLKKNPLKMTVLMPGSVTLHVKAEQKTGD